MYPLAFFYVGQFSGVVVFVWREHSRPVNRLREVEDVV